MTFFEIRDPDFDSEKIEAEILSSLAARNIPLEQERERIDRYDREAARKDIFSQPLNRFKLMCLGSPRWLIRLVKVFPFYKSLRKLFNIHPR